MFSTEKQQQNNHKENHVNYVKKKEKKMEGKTVNNCRDCSEYCRGPKNEKKTNEKEKTYKWEQDVKESVIKKNKMYPKI